MHSNYDRMMSTLRFLVKWSILLTLLMLTVSCSQPSLPQMSLTPTVVHSSLTPLPTLAPTPTFSFSQTSTNPPLGAIPRDCPQGPPPQPLISNQGSAVGGSEVWAVGFAGPHAAIHIPFTYDTYTQHGWSWKLIWEMGPSHTSPATISGRNLRTGSPLWFQISDPYAPVVSLVLDPRYPDHPGSVVGPDWKEWGSYIFIPTADCYSLQATWPGGHWQVNFAAGW